MYSNFVSQIVVLPVIFLFLRMLQIGFMIKTYLHVSLVK